MTSDVTAPPDGDADAACITGARRCRDEYPRQLAHLVLGVGGGVLILLLPRGLSAAILAGALPVGFLVSGALVGVETDVSRSGRFVGTFIRARERPGSGANYTGLSTLAALLLFSAPVVAASTIAFGVLDSVSTIAGLRYGRRLLSNGKSVEGTLAPIACTAPVLLLFLSPPAAVAVAFVGALAELVLRSTTTWSCRPCSRSWRPRSREQGTTDTFFARSAGSVWMHRAFLRAAAPFSACSPSWPRRGDASRSTPSPGLRTSPMTPGEGWASRSSPPACRRRLRRSR